MSKQRLNFVIDAVVLLSILALVGTGIVLRYLLPPRSNALGLSIWGLGRHDWGDVHFWCAVGLAALLLLHLALHWRWVCEIARGLVPTRQSPRPRMGGGALTLGAAALILTLMLVLAGFVWIANANVATDPRGGERGQGFRGGLGMQMSTTQEPGLRSEDRPRGDRSRDLTDRPGRRNRRGWAGSRDDVQPATTPAHSSSDYSEGQQGDRTR